MVTEPVRILLEWFLVFWQESHLEVVDPAAGYGEARNMKSMQPYLAAILFMTDFYRTEGMAPLLPPPPRIC